MKRKYIMVIIVGIVVIGVGILGYLQWNRESGTETFMTRNVNTNITTGIVLSGSADSGQDMIGYAGEMRAYLSWADFDSGYAGDSIDGILQKMIAKQKVTDGEQDEVKKQINDASMSIKFIEDKKQSRSLGEYFVVSEGTWEKNLETSYTTFNQKSKHECEICIQDCASCNEEIGKKYFWWFKELIKEKRMFIYEVWGYEYCWDTVVQEIDSGNYKEFFCANYMYDAERGRLFIFWSDDDFGGVRWFGITSIEKWSDGLIEQTVLPNLNSLALYIEGKYIYYIYGAYDEIREETFNYLIVMERDNYAPVLQKNLWVEYRNTSMGY